MHATLVEVHAESGTVIRVKSLSLHIRRFVHMHTHVSVSRHTSLRSTGTVKMNNVIQHPIPTIISSNHDSDSFELHSFAHMMRLLIFIVYTAPLRGWIGEFVRLRMGVRVGVLSLVKFSPRKYHACIGACKCTNARVHVYTQVLG